TTRRSDSPYRFADPPLGVRDGCPPPRHRRPLGRIWMIRCRSAVLQSGVQFGRALAQALRLSAVLPGGSKARTSFAFAITGLQLRLGPLALCPGSLLLRSGAFGLGPSLALAGTGQMLARLDLLPLGLDSLALGRARAHPRKQHGQHYRNDDDHDDDHDEQ